MFDKLYITTSGEHRKYGIYSPGLDRFILIDSNDVWVTLQTAELLSSKIPTVAYVLSDQAVDINNDNCINFSILSKTNQKIGPSTISIARQQPQLNFLNNNNIIVDSGLPVDFLSSEKQQYLVELKDFSMYVHKLSYVINILEASYNSFNNKNFVNKYLPTEWHTLEVCSDRSQSPISVFDAIRQDVYLGNSVVEINTLIKQTWISHILEQGPVMARFYELLSQPVPEELSSMTEFKQVNSSIAII